MVTISNENQKRFPGVSFLILVGFVGKAGVFCQKAGANSSKAGVNFFISYRLFIRIRKFSINLKKSGIYG